MAEAVLPDADSGSPENDSASLPARAAAAPRIAVIWVPGLYASPNTAVDAVARVVDAYKENAKKGERIGKTIERLGLDPFREAL